MNISRRLKSIQSYIHTVLCLVAQWCPALCDPMDSSVCGDSPGKNTRVGCHTLFQGVFPTQESNPGVWHCRRILYSLSHQVSTRVLEWVAYLFSGGSSQPSDQTGVSCFAGGFFTNWATQEALCKELIMRTYCIAWGTLLSVLWWPKREGNPKKRASVYTYDWFSLLYSRK